MILSIINSGTDMYILTPTHSMKVSISWTTIPKIQLISYTIRFVSRYFTCPRFDRRYPISSLISLPGKFSLLDHNIGSLWLPLNHTFANFQMLYYWEGPENIYSITWRDKCHSWFMSPNNLPSEIPESHLYNHPVMKWRLMSTKYSSGKRKWHNLMVKKTILGIY